MKKEAAAAEKVDIIRLLQEGVNNQDQPQPLNALQEKMRLRQHVRGFYDLQKLRIAKGNRVCASVYARLGFEQGKKQDKDKAERDAAALLVELRKEHARITDAFAGNLPRIKQFKGSSVISDYSELSIVHSYVQLLEQEEDEKKTIGELVKKHPIHEWMNTVWGCGVLTQAVIISEIDIHKAKYVSSLWQYAGFGVGPDGAGMSKRAAHLVDREYLNSRGEKKNRKGIVYNPFLKTKLFLLGDGFIKAVRWQEAEDQERTRLLDPSLWKEKDDVVMEIKEESPYRTIWRDYKNRLANSENLVLHGRAQRSLEEMHEEGTKDRFKGYTRIPWKDASAGHRHDAARRYAVKMFLRDLYIQWRTLEGLEVHPPYAEGKLGMLPHGHGQGG